MRKRKGRGGNESRDPRGNLDAHEAYRKKFGLATKRCTGFLHHDSDAVPVEHFRQAKNNSSTFLQSRCDVCNRLYFAILQKPKIRILAIVIWADSTSAIDWRQSCPILLAPGIEAALADWRSGNCGVDSCEYSYPHGSLRRANATLTDAWRDLDKGPKVATIIDDKTGAEYPAPEFMKAMQQWGGQNGPLSFIAIPKVFEWWQTLFANDTVHDSEEESAVKNGKMEAPPPEYSIFDTFWGSGNLKSTVQGHSIPAFNQVKKSARESASASGVSGRPYIFLCEGNHLEVRRMSREYHRDGVTLGHHPAPVRWLGKDDTCNVIGQDKATNIRDRDSLAHLHAQALRDPERAGTFVSWQVRALVIRLGREGASLERFTSELAASVETYCDRLEEQLQRGALDSVVAELKKADPGRPSSDYEYRLQKLEQWLKSRPASRKRRQANS